MSSFSKFGRMEGFLRDRRDRGSKLLVAYVTGGYEGWEAAVEAAAAGGADAIEIGIPFSAPVMDSIPHGRSSVPLFEISRTSLKPP